MIDHVVNKYMSVKDCVKGLCSKKMLRIRPKGINFFWNINLKKKKIIGMLRQSFGQWAFPTTKKTLSMGLFDNWGRGPLLWSQYHGKWKRTCCHCKAVIFSPNPHYRHPIPCPWRWDMGCLLWVQSLIQVIHESLHWQMKIVVEKK